MTYLPNITVTRVLTFSTQTNTNYAMSNTDKQVVFSTGATNRTCTLPAIASSTNGQIYTITKLDSSAGAVIITPQSGNISGASTLYLYFQYESVDIQVSGSNHIVL